MQVEAGPTGIGSQAGAEQQLCVPAVGVVGEGRALYRAVVDADLEGIVAKHLADVYHPKLARWHKILNRAYTQRHGRAEWFLKRRGRYAKRG
jgi:hypothetical protein